MDGQRLREARERANLTQEQLADAAGVSQQAICGYETGRRSGGRYATVIAIAAALGVDPAWLAGTDEGKQHGADRGNVA